ncbi:MAG: hypothetical protein ACT4OU_09240 [Hyphomicrobium sp.]
MIRKLAQRCFVVLGMLAMLGMIAAVPLGSALAGEKAGMAATEHGAGDMPCHKPVKSEKPCPDCPEKACPDGVACMVKCFQQLSGVLSKSPAFAIPVIEVGALAPDAPPPRASPAPPLRPPID